MYYLLITSCYSQQSRRNVTMIFNVRQISRQIRFRCICTKKLQNRWLKLRSERFVRTHRSYESPCFSIVFPNFHCLKIARTAFVAVRNGICERDLNHSLSKVITSTLCRRSNHWLLLSKLVHDFLQGIHALVKGGGRGRERTDPMANYTMIFFFRVEFDYLYCLYCICAASLFC